MRPLGIGMIGAGAISNAHLPAVASSDKTRLICVADINEDLAAQKADQYGASRHVTDYSDLLAIEEVEAVIIGIPAGLHAQVAVDACEAGKHVMVEKPMARTLQECDAMIAAADRAGKVLQVAMVRRFDADWGKMRELALAGKVGRPCVWRRLAQGSPPQPPYGAWYSDCRYSDGPLAESGAHDFDFVRYTFGDVKAVTASTRHVGHIGDVQDMNIVIVDFDSGDQMLCMWCWSLPPGCSAGVAGLDVMGPDGVILAPSRLEDGASACVVNGPGGAQETVPFDSPRDGAYWFPGQLDNFVESIRGQQTPRATGLDGRKAQEIVLAAFESSKTGRRIDLPLS